VKSGKLVGSGTWVSGKNERSFRSVALTEDTDRGILLGREREGSFKRNEYWHWFELERLWGRCLICCAQEELAIQCGEMPSPDLDGPTTEDHDAPEAIPF